MDCFFFFRQFHMYKSIRRNVCLNSNESTFSENVFGNPPVQPAESKYARSAPVSPSTIIFVTGGVERWNLFLFLPPRRLFSRHFFFNFIIISAVRLRGIDAKKKRKKRILGNSCGILRRETGEVLVKFVLRIHDREKTAAATYRVAAARRQIRSVGILQEELRHRARALSSAESRRRESERGIMGNGK